MEEIFGTNVGFRGLTGLLDRMLLLINYPSLVNIRNKLANKLYHDCDKGWRKHESELNRFASFRFVAWRDRDKRRKAAKNKSGGYA